jgi:DNA-binding CsgD family transcriptional regulator
LTSKEYARHIDAIWADANSASDVENFRRRLIEHVGAVVGMDTGLVTPSGPLGDDDVRDLVNVGVPPAALAHYLRNRTRFYPSLQPLIDALVVYGAIDHDEVMGGAWKRVAFHREVIEPLGIIGVATAALVFRGKGSCLLSFNRSHGSSSFRARDLDRFRRLVPVAAMADVAVAARCDPRGGRSRLLQALSPRERDIASLIVAGLQNKEIAVALGTTLDTVRKQTMSVYAKLGVSGRVQLAARLARGLD